MIETDRQPFAEALFMLGETFNEPISDVKSEAYFDALREFPLSDITSAVRAALRTSKFFPRPAELRELILGSAGENADQAWANLLREVRRVGYIGTPNLEPATMQAIKSLWGSWARLCETLPGEGPELVGWIKQFKATYSTAERGEAARELTAATMDPTVRAFIQAKQARLR